MKYTTKQVRGGHAAYRVSTKGGVRFFSTLRAAARFAVRVGRASIEVRRDVSNGPNWLALPLEVV